MVLGIQASQAGLVSTEFVQENFEGIQDVDLERRRIDLQQLRDMAFARLMQGMESGEVPASAMVKIAQARADGDDIFVLFDKFIVQPQDEAEEASLTSGLDGSQMMPPMGYSFYATMTENDLDAVILFLRSLPPLPSPG